MADKVRGPFARVHDSWVDEWARAGLGRTQLLVMLKLCERIEFDKNGNATSWYPRDEMAREIGVTETAVKRAIQRLGELEFLVVRKSGRRGSSTLYVVMPHSRWPMSRGTADGTPNSKKGYRDDAHRGTADGTPLRNKECGSPAGAGTPPERASALAEIMRRREEGWEPEWLK